MIAIRAHPLKPAMVVYHRPEKVDELAVKLAEIENIPLIRTNLDVNVLIERLGRL
jgi:putative transcriptional regulator